MSWCIINIFENPVNASQTRNGSTLLRVCRLDFDVTFFSMPVYRLFVYK